MATSGEAAQAGGEMPPATAIATGGSASNMVRVWDPFVRIFHWSLMVLFLVAFATGDELERMHIAVGYIIAALVALRIVWGFVGPRHARFSDFVRSAESTLAYMRKAFQGQARRHLGHNPAGGMMMLALLAMIAAIAATGFMMTTKTFWGSEWVEELHEGLVYATLGLIALHMGGVLLASYQHGENLVKAMMTGRKRAA